MDKILEALSKLALPENDLKTISSAISEMVEEAKVEIEAKLQAEFDEKVEEAYASLAEELTESEQTGEQGYREAWAVITDLRNRIEVLRAEYDAALSEGYEEAYQTVLAEKGKNESLESDLHEEYEKRFTQSKGFVVDKLDEFLRTKGKEIYEMARKDILNDPSMVEHRVTLERVIESVSDYISDEDRVLATSSRLNASKKALEESNSRIRMLEAKNIRLSTENNKLNEQVKQATELLSESEEVALSENKKARVEKAKNVSGRGKVTTGKTEVVSEYAAEQHKSDKTTDTTMVETFGEGFLHDMQVLAGTKLND